MNTFNLDLTPRFHCPHCNGVIKALTSLADLSITMDEDGVYWIEGQCCGDAYATQDEAAIALHDVRIAIYSATVRINFAALQGQYDVACERLNDLLLELDPNAVQQQPTYERSYAAVLY